jgi:hypothetical protein
VAGLALTFLNLRTGVSISTDLSPQAPAVASPWLRAPVWREAREASSALPAAAPVTVPLVFGTF